jgi:hypothetical protein
MNKLIKTTIAVFVTIWVTDFLIHGLLLKSMYVASASLWRPETAMKTYCGYMLFGQIMIAAAFTWIFSHGYKGKGWKEGVRYGVAVGTMAGGTNLIMYAVQPYPFSIVAAWLVLGCVQSATAGVVATMVYKK